MRTHGTLAKWNDDRGFGFVTIPQGVELIFVHISAFPSDGMRPRVGEMISFEIRTASDGRKRAENVERPAGHNVDGTSRSQKVSAREYRRSPLGAVLVGFMIVAAGFVAYSEYSGRRVADEPISTMSNNRSNNPGVTRLASDPTSEPFKCDGRTHCSQMTSCEEAEYFLRNCPDTKMDGNYDGEPCERQCDRDEWYGPDETLRME